MRKNLIRKFLLVIGDIGIIIFSIYFSFILRFQKRVSLSDLNPVALLLSSLVYISFFYIFGTYDLGEKRFKESKRNLIFVVLACLSASITNAFIFYALPSVRYGRGLFGIQFILITFLVVVFRLGASFAFKVTSNEKKVLIIIAPREEHNEIKELLRDLLGYKVLDYLDFSEVGNIDVNSITNGRIDEVVFSGAFKVPEYVQEKILEIKVSGVQVLEITTFMEEVFEKIPIAFLKKDWILVTEGFSFFHTKVTQKIKRIMDLFFSLAGLLISFPLWLTLPVLIRVDSEGPIIYKQLRVGKNRNLFWLLKFRTMIKEAEKGEAKWATESDPRVTRVGRILRKLRVDEVPQLINVLKGEMSLIGPRPERPDFVDFLEKQIPFIRFVIRLLPG